MNQVRGDMMLNWLFEQNEFNTMKSSEEDDNQTNCKFNSSFEGNFLENTNQSRQSNHQNQRSIESIPYETASIPIKRLKNIFCFERTDKQTQRKLLGLIDMGMKYNLISERNVKHGKLLKLKYPTFIETEFGQFKIFNFVKVNVFSHVLNFLVVDTLGEFDILLGMDGLEKINAKIDFISLELTYQSKVEKKMDKTKEIVESKIKTVGNFDTKESVELIVKTKLKKAEEIEELKIVMAAIAKIEMKNIEREKLKNYKEIDSHKNDETKFVELSKNNETCREIESHNVRKSKVKKIQIKNVEKGEIGDATIEIDEKFKNEVVIETNQSEIVRNENCVNVRANGNFILFFFILFSLFMVLGKDTINKPEVSLHIAFGKRMVSCMFEMEKPKLKGDRIERAFNFYKEMVCKGNETNVGFETKGAVEAIKNAKLVKSNIPLKVQVNDKIKILKNAEMNSRFRFKFSSFFKSFAEEQSVMNDVAMVFKYFEPG